MIRRIATLFLASLVTSATVSCQSDAETSPKKKKESTFTVLAYNVENFFDVDDIAIFDDYEVEDVDSPFGYNRYKLLTKLKNAVAVLKVVNSGKGPDIILFQEFENDFTPPEVPIDFESFLEAHGDKTAASMLTVGWREHYADIPAVAWMAKAMADAGMSGYAIAVAPPMPDQDDIAHVNAVFSRFPILEASAHPIPDARDIQEVAVSIDGETLWLYNNHWKSGASSPQREPIRVENAKVLRQLIDARLAADPKADIIIGGDLNSHYNHSVLFPDMVTGINDTLGSAGDEAFRGTDLYNLWFELPVEARYSEVWRGNRGTLMHLIVSPGLYDEHGVSYVDSSFDKLVVPGLNVDALGRPLDWHFAGRDGGGVSDHLPVGAVFTTAPFAAKAPLSDGSDTPDYEIPLVWSEDAGLALEDGAFLGSLSDDELASHVGKLYRVSPEALSAEDRSVRVRGYDWAVYIPAESVQADFRRAAGLDDVRLVVRPGFWKGERQFIVEAVENLPKGP